MKIAIITLAMLTLPSIAQAKIVMEPISCPLPSEVGFKVVGAKGEVDGIASEYEWIKANRKGWNVLKQSVHNQAGKTFDILYIQKAGEKQSICFDISDFFGRY